MSTANTSFVDDPSTWRNRTPGGIPYRILEQTGTIEWNRITVTETYIIQVSRFPDFIRESFPLPHVIDSIPQWQARSLPGILRLLCTSITYRPHIEGLPIDPFQADKTAPPNSYGTLLRVEVTYSDESQQPGSGGTDVDPNDPQTFLDIRINGGGEFFTMKGSRAKWKNDLVPNAVPEPNTDIDNPTSLLVPQIEWSLDWPMLNRKFYEDVMVSRLRAALGHVNSETYAVLYDAEPETLLVSGWEVQEERQIVFDAERELPQYKDNPVRLSVKILEKRIPSGTTIKVGNEDQEVIFGHNHFWHDKSGGWRRFLPDGTSSAFKTYDFNQLFAPEE